jgi:ABC-type Fe3+/spermidine/putrescine transport system ATPase subunit
VGIRPEKIRIDPLGTRPSGPNRTTATVTEVTFLGASTEARLVTAWGTLLQAYKQNAGGETTIRPGDEVEVSWDASQSFFLPPTDPSPAPEAEPESKEVAA